MDDEQQRATAWLSCDLAELAEEMRLYETPHCKDPKDSKDKPHFDVVIVGSGYGGAMALSELAGQGIDGMPLRIAMLERGKEYLAGAFPSRMGDLAGHVRFSRAGTGAVHGQTPGLFDLRIGGDVNVVLANGLGGGSLINAGVMAAPLPEVFQDPRWPDGIRNDADLLPAMTQVRRQLESTSSQAFSGRSDLMTVLGRGSAYAVDITVAQQDDTKRGIKHCTGCRDCATGCNERAKLSLDVTLIADACARHPEPLRIVTGATVTTFARLGEYDWKVSVTHTDTELRRHIRVPYVLRTRCLILAAGALGSTELLMRARKDKLAVSAVLGERFSTNGDNLSTIYRQAAAVPSVVDQDGPTITRMIDLREAHKRLKASDSPVVIQDLAIPVALRRLLEESATTVATIRSLTTADTRRYVGGEDEHDSAGIDKDAVDNSLVVAVIGHDSASGRLSLPPDAPEGTKGNKGTPKATQGTLGVVWPEVRDDPSFEHHQDILERLVAHHLPGAAVLPNPVWRPLPDVLEQLYGVARGPVLTVHPLGGCAMGETVATGVVDEYGRVFEGDAKGGVHEGLAVLDGSIMPTSLGINPSLTIATLARRAIRQLRVEWGFAPLDATTHSPRPPAGWTPSRPVFTDPAAPRPVRPTCIEMTEQMKGSVTVECDGKSTPLDVELTLWFKPTPIPDLIAARSKRQLVVDTTRSRVRLFTPSPARAPVIALGAPTDPGTPAQDLVLEAPISGNLTLMRHSPSGRLFRTISGLWSWFRNRGLRDITQSVVDRLLGRAPKRKTSIWTLVKSVFDLASRAADTRLLEYKLELLEPDQVAKSLGLPMHWEGQRIHAVKRLTYERAANPANQWMYADLLEFPHRDPGDPCKPLAVDLPYFGTVNVPLVRVVSQADQASALVDVASLLLYVSRVMLPLHAWSLRLPDRPEPRVAQRLPGAIKGLPAPEIVELTVDVLRNGDPVRLRLTRYGPGARRDANPVMLIHGYSASGTTFAHPLLPGGGLAGALHRDGRDVWVLDLRSSAGMPTAREPWFFEQMGCQDIPLAVDHICRCTGKERVDIVAHCMGAAMLALGLFGDRVEHGVDRFPALRKALPDRLGWLVLSQVGPALVMSPANMARAYLMQWLRQFVGLGSFEFTPDKPGVADDMVDRLLAAVPYPPEDFVRENPMWPPWERTPWVGARHRMDALYGVTFKLDGMSDAVLAAIDDFFGPMNLQTVAQVIAFARYGVVTDRRGNGACMVPSRIAKVWQTEEPTHRTLCLHSTDNGLLDIATRRRMVDLLNDAHCGGQSMEFQDMGHQDSLIGGHAPIVYRAICKFLSKESSHDHEPRVDPSSAAAQGAAAEVLRSAAQPR